MKRISVLLTILLILSSFPMSSASAKVSNTVRQDAELFTNSLTYSPTQPSTGNARDSLYNTYQRIRNSIPIGGTPYTKESQQRFNAALRAAEDLLGDATATDVQLYDAESELIAAFNALERSTANRDNLWTAINTLRGYIESEEYLNFSNAAEIKEIYDNALPVAYYEPEQSVIDEWEAKIYAALKKAGVITEPTTYSTEPTGTTDPQSSIPYSEPPTDSTEPTESTEDPTGHCTEHDLPYSPEFGVALANYSFGLVGDSLTVSDIELFYFDQSMVVFGMTDMLCTEGEEDIDGYHFENWNFFPREANKTGYCVYCNGTIYNLPDAVKNNIMSASTLASIIPHSSKIDNSTAPTSSTATSESTFITEPTTPSETNPTTGDSRARDDLSKLLTKYKWVYEECKNSSSQSIFYFESVQGFIGTYESAQALINDGTATEQQYVDAHTNLTQAYANLTEAHTQGTEVTDARRALKYAVYNCVPRDGYEYTSEALSAYNQAYDEAVDLLNGNDATDDQLRTARAKLFSAYNELMRTATYITEPTNTTCVTEPSTATENPTGHCTEFDLPYSPDFAVALANYTNNLVGESLSVSDIDLFHYDQTTVVFGLSDNLCTEGHEDIDGYHFENWNFFPHEANKTGYCVYYNGTIYNLPDTVSNNIMTASALASIIPHSSKLEGSTQPTETTESSQPIITEPTDPTATTEDPTGHCTDNEEMFRQIFATELAEYSNELGYEEPFSIEDVEFFYRNQGSMAVFALRDKWCTVSEETIDNYKFTNPSFFGNPKNKTGLCVYYNNTIFSIAKAVQEGYVTAEFLASVIPNTTFVGSTETTETTPTQPASTAPVTYNISKAKVAAVGNKTYTGKAITPTVKVTYNGKILLKNKDYTLSYKNNKNVGTASIIITGKGSCTGTKTVTFKIVKAVNTMTVKATAKTVKYSKLKNAKQTVSAITVKKAIGKVSYKKTSGKSFFTVNSKTGKITIKKGIAKGTYTVKVKVSAAGSSNYKSGSKTVTVKIKVK